MYWDDLLRRWRRENPQLGPRLLAGAAGRVAVAPSRRRQSRRIVLALLVAALVLLALAVGSGRVHAATMPDGFGLVPDVAMTDRSDR
jgi:ferric-dicitrate binding protein FerR (iron transport regulator)